jgi:hypothetical protein
MRGVVLDVEENLQRIAIEEKRRLPEDSCGKQNVFEEISAIQGILTRISVFLPYSTQGE